jgi:hypothetical protein
MKILLRNLFHRMIAAPREHWQLSLETMALHHQLGVLERSGKRPRFSPADRCFWIVLSMLWSRWPDALEIIQTATVHRWRRQGIWHHLGQPYEWKRPGRPAIAAETRALIQQMSRENVLWGAPRIHGELAKLGIMVSRTTVAKYMARRPGPPLLTWRTCIRLHSPEFVTGKASGEVLRSVRALYTAAGRALRHWLRRAVSGGRQRTSGCDVIPLAQPCHTVPVPALWVVDIADRVHVSERSPPGLRSSSNGDPFADDLTIAVGTAPVCLAPLAMGYGCGPYLRSRHVQGEIKARGKGTSRRAAA